jgi:uncharacterized protein (TIGR02996 family)
MLRQRENYRLRIHVTWVVIVLVALSGVIAYRIRSGKFESPATVEDPSSSENPTVKELLDAIAEDPEEPKPLLAYADWLDRQGEPAKSGLAEFVRIQTELHELGTSDQKTPEVMDRARQLVERANHLLINHSPDWFGMQADPTVANLDVGEGLWVWARNYLKLDEAKLEFAPILRMTLGGANYDGTQYSNEQDFAQLATRPSLRQWCSLVFNETNIPRDCFLKLVASPYMYRLGRFDVWETQIEDAGVEAMARSKNFAHLRHLSLNSIGDDGKQPGNASLRALAKSPHITKLRTLHLCGGFTDDGVAELAGSPNLAHVRSLWLNGRLTGKSMESLAASPDLTMVTDLNVGCYNTSMDARGIRALLNWPQLGKIKSLRLVSTGLTDEGLEALARCPRVSNLESLDLMHNSLRDKSTIETLANSPFLKDIKKLNLWGVTIGGRQISPETREILESRFGNRVTLIPADMIRKLDDFGK